MEDILGTYARVIFFISHIHVYITTAPVSEPRNPAVALGGSQRRKHPLLNNHALLYLLYILHL